jgi:RNA polymerase sigma factor (sigma-70 family)
MSVSRTKFVVSQLRKLAGAKTSRGFSDGELLAQFVASRDESAFGSLLDRHGNMVLHVCRRVLNNHQDAEDAFQGTFLLLAQKAQSILNQESVASWLYKVAHRAALELRWRISRRQVRETRAGHMRGKEPAVRAAWEELHAALDEELYRLPAKYQAPLVLCYLEGKTHDDVARQLGCPVGTINSRLAYARDLLKKRLAQRGLILPAATLAAVLAVDVASAAPLKLLRSTCAAALAQAAGQIIPEGLVSAQAAALTKGGLSAMTTHLKIGVALLLVLGAAAAGASAMFTGHSPKADSQNKADPAVADFSRENPLMIKADSSAKGSDNLDRNGDAMPAEALARLGSMSFRSAAYSTPHDGLTLTFTHDGKQLAVANTDYTITLWDASTGKKTAQIAGLEKPIELAAPGQPSLPVQPVFAFSPDDKLAAIVVPDMEDHWDSIHIWDVKQNKELTRLTGKTMRCGRCLFAPDGKSVIAADRFMISRWALSPRKGSDGKEALIGEALPSCEGHKIQVTDLAFSADGRTIVSGGYDQKVCLWDAETGKLKKSFMKHRDSVVAVAISPDSKRIASRGKDDTVHVWDAETGEDVQRWYYPIARGFPFGVTGNELLLRFGADGKTLIVGNTIRYSTAAPTVETLADSQALAEATVMERGVDTLDIASGELTHHFPVPNVTQLVTLSPDGKLAVRVSSIGDYSNLSAISVWDFASNKRLTRPVGHVGAVLCIAFSPDGETVATGGRDRTVRLWEAASGTELKKLTGHTEAVTELRFSPDGKHLASAAGRDIPFNQRCSDHNVSWWDVATGKEIRQFSFRGLGDGTGAQTLGLSSDGTRLNVIDNTGTRQVWNTETGEKIGKDLRVVMSGAVSSADGRMVVYRNQPGLHRKQPGGGQLRIWDTSRADNDAVRALNIEENDLIPTAVSADGRMVLVHLPERTFPGFERDGELQFWNLNSGTLRRALKTKEAPGVESGEALIAAFSPDGRSLAVSYRDGVIAVLEIATFKEQHRFRTDQDRVTTLAFSMDSSRLASGGGDGTVLVFDLSRAAKVTPNAELTKAEMESLWADLANDSDAAKGFRAVRALAASAKQAAPFLRKQLPPVSEEDQRQIDELIADLGSKDSDARKKAETELSKTAQLARRAMERALEKKPSIEVCERLNGLVQAVDEGRLSAEDIRLVRVLQAIEGSGAPEATDILREWAKGASGAWLTEEARASLKRVENRK